MRTANMIDRTQTEKMLRLNGIEPDATPEEIRTVLIRARWHKDDVDAAVEALGRAPDELTIEHNSGKKITHSDLPIAPETLSAVLGIDVELTQIRQQNIVDQNWFLRKQIISLALITILGAALFVLFVMWHLELTVLTPVF